MISNLYQPAASVSVHVAEDLNWFGAVVVNKDGVDPAFLISVLHDLNAVHGEGVNEADYRKEDGM